MAALGFNDRKHKRKAVLMEALLHLPGSSAPRQCRIIDISQGGARLSVDPTPLPKTFTLLLSANGAVRRVCVLRWRRDREVGVEFV
jgi:hypothetical protein